MNKQELIDALLNEEEEEVFVLGEDGMLHDIEIDREEQTFDGFYTVTPASLVLKAKHDDE
jgi:hypothetical protein